MSAPHTKRSGLSGSGIGVIDLTTGQIRRDAYLYDNKELIIQGITGVVRSYYFAFDSIPEYSEHTKSMTLLNEKIEAYAKEKIRLEEEAADVRSKIEAMGEEPKLESGSKGIWAFILLLVLLFAYWIFAAVLSGSIGFDPAVRPVTDIIPADAVFASLPVFLIFPQAVYYQAAGLNAITAFLANPVVMVVMFLLPLLLILGFIIRLIRRSHAVKRYEEDLAAYRQNRKELEEKLADVENRILQDTKDTASVSDELNSTQTNFANAQLGQYHKLAERYGSLLKYRSLIPEQYHNPIAMSELVKIVTTMGSDSWGEALELCDIKMMSGEGIPLTNDLYQQISRYFHNDKCVMHMISICENDAKMEALTETWKNNQRVNAEYLNYEKTLQAQAARSDT